MITTYLTLSALITLMAVLLTVLVWVTETNTKGK